jgi:hypothetical protein
MGRWYCSRKATANESCRLEMSYLRKRGMLSGQATENTSWTSSMTGKETTIGLTVDITTDNPYARLVYAVTDRGGNKTDYDYEVSLVTTPCNLGGVRYWFGCPSCGRRVGILYLAPGDVYFRCRNCNNLSYHSRNESSPYGILGVTERKIDKLRSEIKRWTWRGSPTRKVRRLHALERKIGMLSVPIRAQMEKFEARLR